MQSFEAALQALGIDYIVRKNLQSAFGASRVKGKRAERKCGALHTRGDGCKRLSFSIKLPRTTKPDVVEPKIRKAAEAELRSDRLWQYHHIMRCSTQLCRH